MTKLQELQQRRVAVSEQLTELGKAGFASKDQRDRFDALQLEAKSLGDDITRLESASQLETELRRTTRPPAGNIENEEREQKSATRRWDEYKARKEEKKAERKLAEQQESAAFRYWALTGQRANCLRSGEVAEDGVEMKRLASELRDMGISSPTASIPTSVFVPQGFVYDVEIALKAIGNFISACDEIPTSTGSPLPYPTSNDVAVEAEIVGEGQTVNDQDVGIGNVVLQAWKYDTKMVPVSLELLQDSAFDMDKFLSSAFAIRLQRGLTRDFTYGSGNSCPRGIYLDAQVGATASGASKNSGDATQSGANSIGSADLLNLIHSVDPLYRFSGKFAMHDTTIQVLEQTLDKFGRPLYLPNPQTGKLESIFGYPIVMNQYMDQVGVHSPEIQAMSVLFGDLKKYKIRKVKDLAVLRLVERAAEKGQVLFIGFARYDGRLVDAGTHPVKVLEMLSQ